MRIIKRKKVQIDIHVVIFLSFSLNFFLLLLYANAAEWVSLFVYYVLWSNLWLFSSCEFFFCFFHSIGYDSTAAKIENSNRITASNTISYKWLHISFLKEIILRQTQMKFVLRCVFWFVFYRKKIGPNFDTRYCTHDKVCVKWISSFFCSFFILISK